jgi:hypothetical protein
MTRKRRSDSAPRDGPRAGPAPKTQRTAWGRHAIHKRAEGTLGAQASPLHRKGNHNFPLKDSSSRACMTPGTGGRSNRSHGPSRDLFSRRAGQARADRTRHAAGVPWRVPGVPRGSGAGPEAAPQDAGSAPEPLRVAVVESERLTPEGLWEGFLSRRVPVVIRGYPRDPCWQAGERWSLDYLASKAVRVLAVHILFRGLLRICRPCTPRPLRPKGGGGPERLCMQT